MQENEFENIAGKMEAMCTVVAMNGGYYLGVLYLSETLSNRFENWAP